MLRRYSFFFIYFFPIRDSLWRKAMLLPDGLWQSAMPYDADLWHSAMSYGDVGLWDGHPMPLLSSNSGRPLTIVMPLRSVDRL